MGIEDWLVRGVSNECNREDNPAACDRELSLMSLHKLNIVLESRALFNINGCGTSSSHVNVVCRPVASLACPLIQRCGAD